MAFAIMVKLVDK